MPQYRRPFIQSGIYFFTVVTYNRLPVLTADDTRPLLHSAWMDVHARFSFTTLAVSLLPDHLHCIWSMPNGDADYLLRWKEIKRLFTKSYLQTSGLERRAKHRVSSEAKRLSGSDAYGSI
jgi:putative transposase